MSSVGMPPFINAKERGLVAPVFTVWLDKKGGNANNIQGGLIVYGEEYVNNAVCGKVEGYVHLSEAKYWQFTLNAYSFDNGVSRSDHRWEVISDTGLKFLIYYVKICAFRNKLD